MDGENKLKEILKSVYMLNLMVSKMYIDLVNVVTENNMGTEELDALLQFSKDEIKSELKIENDSQLTMPYFENVYKTVYLSIKWEIPFIDEDTEELHTLSEQIKLVKEEKDERIGTNKTNGTS